MGSKDDRRPLLEDAATGQTLVTLSGRVLPSLHMILAAFAFLTALALGCIFNYRKIVQNEYFGFPDEFIPSISATTGDRYPARAFFQILCALTAGMCVFTLPFIYTHHFPPSLAPYTLTSPSLLPSGPRFFLHIGTYIRSLRTSGKPRLALSLFLISVIRTVACGGFIYITSTDDHDLHDLCMLFYILLTFPHYLITLSVASKSGGELKWRRRFASFFTLTLFPMIYFFIQHKVNHIAGAYSIYAILEWSLVFYDLAFDTCSIPDLTDLEVRVVDVSTRTPEDTPLWSMPVLGYAHSSPSSPSSKELPRLRGGSSGAYRGLILAADIYLAYLFWTLFTGLPVLIWYFPLWHMGISGYELALFTNIFAAFLGIPWIRRLPSVILQSLASISLLASFLPTPEGRLGLTSLGLVASLMAWIGKMRREGGGGTGPFLLGLLLSLVLKAQWKGNNPAWPIMYAGNGGHPILFTLLAFLAVLLSTSGTRRLGAGWGDGEDLGVSGGQLTGGVDGAHATREGNPTSHRRKEDGRKTKATVAMERRGGWMGAAIGLGSILFALHSLLTDASTPLRWAARSYPNPGPQPLPWSLGTILVGTAAYALCAMKPHLRTLALGPQGTGIALASAMAIYYAPGWGGVLGGWIFTAWVFGAGARALLRHGTSHAPGRTLSLGFLWYNILTLAHVWVVAYAFVPGGDILRERMDLVQGTMCLGLALGIWSGGLGDVEKEEEDKQTSLIHRASSSSSTDHPHHLSSGGLGGRVKAAGILGLMAMAVFSGRALQSSDVLTGQVQPVLPAETQGFTVGIWTIHFALDNDMWASEGRMAQAISELGIDVIGLLESDLQRIIMGHRDLTQALAEELGMYADYGPGPTGHTWGCTMLSRFPILKSTHLLLPSPVGELACGIHATLLVHGREVDVLISHNGQEEDLGDRRLQTATLAKILHDTPRPVVFAGYVVTKPHHEIYQTLMGDGNVEDVDPTDLDRWCEYMAFRGVKRLAYARVSHGGITDTEIQMSRFLLLPPGQEAERHAGKRIREADVHPEILRLPSEFYGQGIRGHRYHVFDEPRYFD